MYVIYLHGLSLRVIVCECIGVSSPQGMEDISRHSFESKELICIKLLYFHHLFDRTYLYTYAYI